VNWHEHELTDDTARIHHAHYAFDTDKLSVDGQYIARAGGSHDADHMLGMAGWALIGDWLPAGQGVTRLVQRPEGAAGQPA
jgi:hypothetical protein